MTDAATPEKTAYEQLAAQCRANEVAMQKAVEQRNTALNEVLALVVDLDQAKARARDLEEKVAELTAQIATAEQQISQP